MRVVSDVAMDGWGGAVDTSTGRAHAATRQRPLTRRGQDLTARKRRTHLDSRVHFAIHDLVDRDASLEAADAQHVDRAGDELIRHGGVAPEATFERLLRD